MSNKLWWQSRTIWLNLVVGIVGVVEASTDALKDVLPPEVLGGLIAGTAALNLVLRTVTGVPVKRSKITVPPSAS